jgi:5-oxoprolinase (ATP-hydrolysing) subunit A
MNMTKVDLNADLGESFGPYVIGNDFEMLDIVTSANIACGFHASDPEIMAKTVSFCIDKNVSMGAHPGFHDLKGFGRRRLEVGSQDEIRYMVLYQIGALRSIIEAENGLLSHVKLHGALNNMACEDIDISRTFTKAVKDLDSTLPIFVVAETELQKAAMELSQPFKCEVFADRAYTDEGQLLSRAIAGAVIRNPVKAADNVLKMIEDGALTSINGKKIPVSIDTICVHGDNAHAVKLAETVRIRLENSGITISSN